ncbi:MAG TPA: hypothetical protein VNU97_07465 [Rhizomicrobium sp.]|jgi:hypothetical protein|nr:hypothetical protein [Rhizomicrobium sp.]
MTEVALAATIHDSDGVLIPAIVRCAGELAQIFSGIALNVSDATAPAVIDAAKRLLNARVIVHPQGEAGIGRARRGAVALALDDSAPFLLYSDFDHLLRWLAAKPEELRATLVAAPAADLLVVGRSRQAFAAEPRRLQETERPVNHAYALMTGHAWDLMFAVRRLSRRAAEAIVRDGRVDTLASDVEWPLLAARAGLSLAYAEADGLYYRTMEGFAAPSDDGDGEALQWLRRIAFAAQHAAVLRDYLPKD